jgi:hypothetical protein
MPIYELTLKGFTFPKQLDEARSTFRFLTSVRFINKEGNFDTAHAVSPGLDTYWECEKKNSSSPFYVRAKNTPEFEMNNIDLWDRLIFTVRANDLHSLQLKVIDIEKTGGLLDKIKDYANSLISSLVGVVKPMVTGTVPQKVSFVKDTLGEAVTDVESLALSTLSGMKGKDSLLFKSSLTKVGDTDGNHKLPVASGDFSIGPAEGHQGTYKIDLHLEIIQEN